MANDTGRDPRVDVSLWMCLPYTVIMQVESENDFVARIGELRGCICHGSTITEALERLTEVQRAWLEMALENGQIPPTPAPESILDWARKGDNNG
jgi:predicted RNase H-like HicB family nuclease